MKRRDSTFNTIERFGEQIGTNGKLRRALGLGVMRNNNFFMIYTSLGFIAALMIALSIEKLQGSISVIVGIAGTLITNMIRGWQEERNTVLNYYFVVDRDGDGIIDGKENLAKESLKAKEEAKEEEAALKEKLEKPEHSLTS